MTDDQETVTVDAPIRLTAHGDDTVSLTFGPMSAEALATLLMYLATEEGSEVFIARMIAELEDDVAKAKAESHE